MAAASVVVGFPLLLLVSPIVLAYLAFHVANGAWLKARFRRAYLPGRPLLLVYSNSPNWKEHIEQRLLPLIADRAVVLNYSERASWHRRAPLAVRVWRHFAGDREFNPCVIAFPPSGAPQVIRLFGAFRDLKHGNPEALQKAEATVMQFLGAHGPGYA